MHAGDAVLGINLGKIASKFLKSL